jgi:exocyst complex component 4
LGVVIQFYQRCSDRFQALTTTPAIDGDQEAQVALAAQWAQRLELQTCLMELMSMKVERFLYQWLSTDLISQEPNDLRQQELYRQETQIEMDFLNKKKKISKADLISSTRELAALASLHRSVVRYLFSAFAMILTLS